MIFMAAKLGFDAYNKVVKGDLERWRSDPEYRSKRRRNQAFGLAAIAGATAGVISGFPKMLENINFVETETTVDGGKQEIIEFDVESELHCWTASTIQIMNASAKDETRIAGVSTGWRETKTNFQVEQRICKDQTTLRAEFDPNTDHLTINVDDADVMRTETNIVPGTFFPVTDQTPSYAIADAFTAAVESTPFIEDTEFAKGIALSEDIQKNKLATLALFAGMKAATDNCAETITKMAAPAVETGLKNVYLPGMNVVLNAMGEKSFDPANVTVLVEGEPISELKIIGEQSNIDEDYAKIMEIQKSHDGITVSQGDKADCQPSAEVQKIFDEAEQENFEAGRN